MLVLRRRYSWFVDSFGYPTSKATSSKSKLFRINMTSADNANTRVIDQLVRAYNAHDARAFADFFSEDAVHGTMNAETRQRGREEIYRRYIDVFAMYPENQTEVMGRFAFGSFVIDHEMVRRSPLTEPFNVVAIYTLNEGLITRLDFARE
jgi:hypothetical protein